MHCMQAAPYHNRYNVVDEADEEEDDGVDEYKASAFSAQLIAEAMSGMELNDGLPEAEAEENISEEIEKDTEVNKYLESALGACMWFGLMGITYLYRWLTSFNYQHNKKGRPSSPSAYCFYNIRILIPYYNMYHYCYITIQVSRSR